MRWMKSDDGTYWLVWWHYDSMRRTDGTRVFEGAPKGARPCRASAVPAIDKKFCYARFWDQIASFRGFVLADCGDRQAVFFRFPQGSGAELFSTSERAYECPPTGEFYGGWETVALLSSDDARIPAALRAKYGTDW